MTGRGRFINPESLERKQPIKESRASSGTYVQRYFRISLQGYNTQRR